MLFFGIEQIDKKGRETKFVEGRRDLIVVGTVTAAAVFVHEQHKSPRFFRAVEKTLELPLSDRNML